MAKLSSLVTPAFVLALALSAAAQEKPVTTKKDMADTVKVNVSGRVALDYVWRSSEITAFTDSLFTPLVPFAPTNDSVPDSENSFEGELRVRIDIEMSDKVSVVVEFGKDRVDGGSIDEFGGGAGEGILLQELRVVIADFLSSGLQLQVGMPDWEFNVRGKGGAFAFGPRKSESITENVQTLADGGGALFDRANDPAELDPLGFYFKYVREQMQIDVLFLPMVIEGGSPSDDEALYAVDVLYTLDNKGSRVGGILALSTGPLDETAVFTLGGAVSFRGIESFELFAEIYFQFGDAGKVGTNTLDANGMALRIGGMWTAQGGAFSLGAMIDMISGDDDTVATDDSVDSFISYENVNDLMIIEDQYFGFDWDANILAIKFLAEMPLQIKAKNDLVLSAILGICKTNEDVIFGPGVSEDALGNELDVRARWSITKQAGLSAAIALLFGSDVLEQSMGGSANDDADDSAILYTLGADLRF